MLYCITTYYKIQFPTGILQILQKRYAGGPRPAPGREHVGGEKRHRKPVEAFFGGSASLSPVRARFRASWALLGSLRAVPCPGACIVIPGDGRSNAWRPSSSEVARAGQLVGLVGVAAFPSWRSTCGRPSRAGVQGWARASANRFSLLNLLFLGLRAAAALDEDASGGSWYRRGPSRAFGKQPGRRPARLPGGGAAKRGNPAGVPRPLGRLGGSVCAVG